MGATSPDYHEYLHGVNKVNIKFVFTKRYEYNLLFDISGEIKKGC
jgi:hypothetical protein